MHPVLEIGRREAQRYTSLMDRRVLLAALVLGAVVGGLWPVVQDRGIHPDAGLYTVAIEEGSPLAPVIASDRTFVDVGDPGAHPGADLQIRGANVLYDPGSDSSRAAARALEQSTRDWLDQALSEEEDRAAAFPVNVDLVFRTRPVSGPASVPTGPGGPGTDGTAPGSSGGADGSGTEANGSASASDLRAGAGTERADLAPSDVTPPFPMESLLLTFAYLIPLTFIGELYGGSVFSERVRSRGRVMLSAPVSGGQILLGKSLPYVAVTVLLALGTTIALGAGVAGFVASLPIVGFALAAALMIALVAPSQRSVTFMLVSTNVLLSTFLFLPAIFTEIPPVSYLSPVGVIAASIRGEMVGLGELVYATAPLALITFALCAIAVGLYRDETLFSPQAGASKLVDGLHQVLDSAPRFVVAGMLAVPVALELFVLVFAVTLDLRSAFVVFLLGSALVEEVLKGLPSYAYFRRDQRRVSGAWGLPVVVGALIGAGFFLGEKGALALALLGFGLLPQGNEALATFGVGSSVALVLAPLLLHVLTAVLTAVGASRSKRAGLTAWVLAALGHAAYNVSVIWFLPGGLGP